MKKGLLSILAGALLVVGCQNYDDQFSSLESQINALASTVAGLSQVQSDLASLSGTVSSLSSTVAGLGSSIDTAVSNGLADITADIAALQAALADVATSDDLAAISAAVAANQADLDELLANSSVFTGDITVNSSATLDSFHAMGSSLAIVNGNVNIDVDTDMDMVKVQELVNQFLTITKDLDYTAEASTIAEVSFDNLTGVQTLTLEQPGGYVLAKLESAQKIYLSDKYETSVDIIDFRSLKSVASFGTDSYTNNTIDFDKATEIHLTALPYVTGTTSLAPLTIKGKKGGVIDITALRDVNAAGDQAALHLSISGPAALTVADLDGEDGSIKVENVASVTINSYDGNITVVGGVETLSADNVVDITFTDDDDLVDVTLTGVADPNYVATTLAPVDYGDTIAITSANLETITLDGTWTSISLATNPKLETAVISADVTGASGIVISGNTDLETLTLTGSKSPLVNVNTNNSLTTLTVDTTIKKATGTTATLDGTLSVTSNTNLESLTISSKDVTYLTITGNTSLATIDGTGLTTLGAGGTTAAPKTPEVSIYGNNLTASLAQDKENATGCEDCDDLEKNDLGAFTTTSKIETLKTYLALVAANAKSDASVYFDTVASTVDKDGTETLAETLYSTGTDAAKEATVILEMSPQSGGVTTGGSSLVKEKRAVLIDATLTAKSTVKVTVDGIDILYRASSQDYGTVTLTGNNAVDVALLTEALTTTRATTLGVKFTANAEGNSAAKTIKFLGSVSSATNGENYTNSQVAAISAGTVSSFLTTWDRVTMTVGDLSVTATLTGASSNTSGNAALKIAEALAAVWNTKYGASGTSSNLSIWGDASTNTSSIDVTISFAAKASTRGSRGFGDTFAITWNSTGATSARASSASSGAVSDTYIDWVIGSTEASTDNAAEANTALGNIIIYLEEDTNSIDATSMQATMAIGVDSVANGSDTSIVLGTSERKYTDSSNNPLSGGVATTTTQNIYPLEARDDVRKSEAAVEGTTSAVVDAVNQTRVHWLG